MCPLQNGSRDEGTSLKARLGRETCFPSSWQLARGQHRDTGQQMRPPENRSLDGWGGGRGATAQGGQRHGLGPSEHETNVHGDSLAGAQEA